MSREDLLAVGVRLFAVFLLVMGVRTAVSLAFAVSASPEWNSLLPAASLSVLLPIAIAGLLWFFPLTLASKLLPGETTPRQPLSGSADALLDVGLILMGLWLLAAALGDAFYWALSLFLASRSEIGPMQFSADTLSSLIATVFELGLAVWILFGAHGIVRAIRRFKQQGLPPAKATE